MAKLLLLISFLLLFDVSFSQKDTSIHRHFGALQFGGQTMFSLHHEFLFFNKKHCVLKTNFGLGINENADDTDPNDRPIYGIHSGFICLIGNNTVSLELGFNPTTYFYKSTTFMNLNGWTGIRFIPKKLNGFFISVGYTPRLYFTYSDLNNRYLNTFIGARIGFRF